MCGVNLPDIKFYHIATTVKIYSISKRIDSQINEQKRKPRNRPIKMFPIDGFQMIFGQSAKVILCRKDSFFNKL